MRTVVAPARNPRDMEHSELVELVEAIRHHLWSEGWEWTPEREWDAETIENVSGELSDRGLAPTFAGDDDRPNVGCEECGFRGWVEMLDENESTYHRRIEKCDTCQTFETDDEALEAARQAGWIAGGASSDGAPVVCRVLEERWPGAVVAADVAIAARTGEGGWLLSWIGSPAEFVAANQDAEPLVRNFVQKGAPFVSSMSTAYTATTPLYMVAGGGAAPLYRVELFVEEVHDGE
jgi:hypothetical protein